VIHLRIVAPPRRAARTLTLLEATSSVCNLVHLPGAVRRPDGDLVMCDVTSDEVSSIVANLRELGVTEGGAIAIEPIESQVADGATTSESVTSASQAVVWEEVDTRTAGMTALSPLFLAMMVLAMLVAMAGIVQATAILIVGAMILGPDFGPVAGVCVAVVERRGRLAVRSLVTLLAGFTFGIVASGLVALALQRLGAFPAMLLETPQHLPQAVSSVVGGPNFLTFFVAFLAGVAGMLSLSTAKTGVIIGVLVSVTTIPAAANVALTATYGQWANAASSAEQVGANILTLLVAGTLTLAGQRAVYARRRHIQKDTDPARAAAGLPVGHG
jgi:uncharacterized hydrophobic protein (TIGR00271 family)